jgi:hypothetical protein
MAEWKKPEDMLMIFRSGKFWKSYGVGRSPELEGLACPYILKPHE